MLASAGVDASAKRRAVHGEAGRGGRATPEYRAWQGMKARCTNPLNHKWHAYGGRGIMVYPGWRVSFAAFVADVGRRPSPAHSLDRIEVNGHYEPGNVRWATATVQCRNRRSNRLLTVDGRTQCLSAWSAESGVADSTLRFRLRAGWPLERALTEPVRGSRVG